MGKVKSKKNQIEAGLLALILVVVGLPLTYFAATSKGLTTSNQHASGCHAVEIPQAFAKNENTLNHIYIHLYKLVDDSGNFCRGFFGHVDVLEGANVLGGNLNLSTCPQNLSNCSTNSPSVSGTGNYAQWIHWDTPSIFGTSCALAGGDFAFRLPGRPGIYHSVIQTNGTKFYCAQ